MKRRTFILISASAAAAVGFTVWYKLGHNAKWKNHPVSYPLVLSSFCDELILRDIGKTYRSRVPDENSKDKLLSLLGDGLSKKQLESSDYEEVAGLLEMKVQKDFKEHKYLDIKGWVISETEARQTALLSLS